MRKLEDLAMMALVAIRVDYYTRVLMNEHPDNLKLALEYFKENKEFLLGFENDDFDRTDAALKKALEARSWAKSFEPDKYEEEFHNKFFGY